MEWKDVTQFLERARTLLKLSTQSKHCVVEAIRRAANVTIPDEQVTVKNGVAWLAVHPAVRNEILLHKEKILSILGDQPSAPRVTELR